MEEFNLKNAKWLLIAKKFPGMTQHDIKNRFVCVMSRELSLKREKIKNLLKQNIISLFIKDVLETLNMKKLENDEASIQEDLSSLSEFNLETNNSSSRIFSIKEFLDLDE